MGSLVYIRLIGYTAGTLLQLFWMVVILGYRRQRNFERVFFFLCLALFLFYSGSLLDLNARIHYVVPPPNLQSFSAALLFMGLCMLPPILVHLHFEYAETRGLIGNRQAKRIVILGFYTPLVFFVVRIYPLLATPSGFNTSVPGQILGRAYGVWLAAAMLVSFWWEGVFTNCAADRPQQWFHKQLAKFFSVMALAVLYFHFFVSGSSQQGEVIGTVLALLAILPSAAMLEMVYRYNFLNIGRQKNLVYAVSVTFLALLYLSLVRRMALWLEPILPPEATAAVLLFVLVIFIEPLQRALGKRLQEAAQREMDRVQRLTGEIQEVARQGDLQELVKFVESRTKAEFELARATLTLVEQSKTEVRPSTGSRQENTAPLALGNAAFPVRQGQQRMATLRAEPHGAALSGETRAALEFLCEQLPGALDLCRLIEEKLQLERALAERERLAVLGQMAASISHNLKNPLGSIKTILQVQLENPELPESMRAETKMVLEEIGRLSAKLNQLLQFSRPAVLGESGVPRCDATEVARQVVGVLNHDAQRKGIALELNLIDGPLRVAAATEAVNDILTNLVVNALDAAPRGGHVRVAGSCRDGQGLLAVEDDGPGVPAAVREKILQPFFTTKAQGTGLGLAIVARRAADAGGKLELESPVKEGKGTRFLVWLPLSEETR